jgi:hypothetical protein
VKRGGARKPESRIVSFRVDDDDFIRLDTLAQQTSYSRAEVLRRCLVGAPLKSTVDAQALTEVFASSRATFEVEATSRERPGSWLPIFLA